MMHGHTLDIIDMHGELGIVTGLLVKTNTFIPSVHGRSYHVHVQECFPTQLFGTTDC